MKLEKIKLPWLSYASWSPTDDIIVGETHTVWQGDNETVLNSIGYFSFDDPTIIISIPGAQNAAWSRDGRQIAFWSVGPGLPTGLAIANLDGTAYKQLYRGANVKHIAWSPDNSLIAFSDFAGEGALVVVTSAGETILEQPGSIEHISWSPDGQFLLYENDQKIYLCRYNGTQREVIAYGSHPDWSADGRIAFYSRPSNAICVSLSGKIEKRIGVKQNRVKFLKWSPDGVTLLFNVDLDAGLRWNTIGLYTYNYHKGVQKLIAGFYSRMVMPMWSYDSTRILGLVSKDHDEGYTLITL